MNQFFVEKIDNLINKIPASNKDPVDGMKSSCNFINTEFKLRFVHPDEVSKIINSMRSGRSCGLDNIDTFIIKLAQYELLPVITHIINLSIKQSKFPSQWKCAKVVPLYKKGDETEPKNYRPVALLPTVSWCLTK